MVCFSTHHASEGLILNKSRTEFILIRDLLSDIIAKRRITKGRKEHSCMPKPEHNIAELPSAFRWKPGPVTDWIDMEFVLQEIDPGLRTQVIAARFETVAAVHRNLAEGATKIAGILGGAKRG
jgi:hypothetical protein